MIRLRRFVGVAGFLPAILLTASDQAAAAPLQRAASAQLLSCPAAHSAFADFDENGILDRVDSVDGSSRAAIRLTLNGTKQLTLVDAGSACRLIVVDFDYDSDDDLVSITTHGELLVWRNEGGALVRVSPQQRASHTNRAWTIGQPTRTPEFAGLNERNLACDWSAVRAHAPPSICSAVSFAVDALGSLSAESSASRAPPTD